LTHSIHVFSDHGIVDHLGGLFDFHGRLLAKRDFALQGVHVDAFADITIPDGIDVLFGAGLNALHSLVFVGIGGLVLRLGLLA
jgi:hypothetical protein